MNNMSIFLSGAVMMAYLILALFFLRFWIRTHDRFFAFFAAAFAVLSIERWFLLAVTPADESHSLVFLIRLAAFLAIAYSVVEKNRGR